MTGKDPMRACLCLLLVACAADPAIVDGEGLYDLTVRWTPGGCGITEVTPANYRVRDAGGLYVVTDEDDPDASISGTVVCGEAQCDLDFVQISTGADVTVEIHHIWRLGADRTVLGNGLATLTTTTGECTQAFTVSGSAE